jgi:class 3 adenylate cyclase
VAKGRGSIFAKLAEQLAALRATAGRWGDTLVIVAVAVAAAVAALALSVTTPVRSVENLMYDLRVSLNAPPAQPDFAIIKIDDDATDAMQAASPCHCLSPINKAWLGDLIATLDAKGVKAIGVDYLLDTWSSDAEFEDFNARIAKVKAPIVVAVDPDRQAGVDYLVSPKLIYSDARALTHKDYDDVIRDYDPKPGRYLSLAAAVGASVGMKPTSAPFLIRYRKPDPNVTAENQGAISPSYSAAFVPYVPAPLLKDKIVFIGSVTRSATADSSTPKEDMHSTPLRYLPGHDHGTPGVEVHVHALSQMMAGDKIHTLDIYLPLLKGKPVPLLDVFWAIGIVLVAGLGGAALGRGSNRWWVAVGIVLIILGGCILGAIGFLRWFNTITPVMAPTMAFGFSFFLMSRLAAVELQNQRAFYSSTLERYLAPQVIDRIVEGQEAVKIGAEEREITVMVSDLENFSNLVATLPLEPFSKVINGYFDGLIEILWKHEAMIDKMTGDGLIVIFGAPIALPDHAARALACVKEIDLFAEAYRERMLAEHGIFGHTRMGLDSGIGLVGNFGGERRFNYTAYGEVVVIAARLEAANKAAGTRILFSAETKRMAGDPEGVRAVGDITLKGVPLPIAAFTVA